MSPKGDLTACFGRGGSPLELPLHSELLLVLQAHKVWLCWCFRSSGGTRGAGSCQWQVSCPSWKNIPRRRDEGSPGSETAGKETSRETAGSRMEIGDFNRALD